MDYRVQDRTMKTELPTTFQKPAGYILRAPSFGKLCVLSASLSAWHAMKLEMWLQKQETLIAVTLSGCLRAPRNHI